MDGDWASGDWNIALDPAAWRLLFQAVPSPSLGLEWEPCHQLVRLIDPIPQLREWVPRIFHVHGKDATVDRQLLAAFGTGGAVPFAWHRTPGFGDTDWAQVCTILLMAGYEGTIDIEGYHDPVFKDDMELSGQVVGLDYLKRCRGGSIVETL
jgi:sugar phosphate isomerase/epimerase